MIDEGSLEHISFITLMTAFPALALTGFVHYGYLWDKNRENRIVDSGAADMVRRIYTMTLEGYGLFQIASCLTAVWASMACCVCGI